MLRACRRVLRPGGRLAFFVIWTAPGSHGVTREELRGAGPEFVEAPRGYGELLADAGFDRIRERDVTAEYRRTATTWLEEADRLEGDLRAVMGDEPYEEKQAERRTNLEAIDSGILGRALLTARAP